MRPFFFQIHWFLGITAGLVLALMGVTGAMMSFENEIMTALSPGIMTVAERPARRLSPDALIARASAQRDGLRVATLVVEGDATRAAMVTFDPPEGKKGRGERSYIDPYDGHLLGQARGAGFFRTVEILHRWLALPGNNNGIGRQITGFSALALVFFALSGLYLRWPRKPLDWRAWLVLDLRRTGRNLYRTLHAVIGGWVLLFYLLSATTGLWWSYDWYRQGVRHALTGKSEQGEREQEQGGRDRPDGPAPMLATAWAALLRDTGGRFDAVTISMPRDGKPVRFRVLLPDARHDRMTDELRIGQKDGRIVKADRYAARPLGETIVSSMYEVHRGAFFGVPGRIAIFLASLTMPLFAVTGLLLYFGRRRKKRALRMLDLPAAAGAGAHGEEGLLIAYASQTGGAERVARQTAAAFDGARLLPLAQVDEAALAEARRALFVVSTHGEGAPPDMARGFVRRMMAAPVAATHLSYAVLALGDREYPDFCAFGHAVDRWLHGSGGRRLFDMIEMNGEDGDAQRQWQQQLAAIGAAPDIPDFVAADYGEWRLVKRAHLNPGSAGAPIFHIVLTPADDVLPQWAAGDIAEVSPRNDPARVAAFLAATGLDGGALLEGERVDARLARSILPDPREEAGAGPDELLAALRPLPHREYSIASVPADGRLELLVRQCVRDDGMPGIGSAWLTAHAAEGGAVALRIRANPGFRAPAEGGPLILIGNGSGLAGLRAHLRQGAAKGEGGHWLLFGERSAAHDLLFDEELRAWLADGTLARLDRCFSRDADCGRHVQQLVAAVAAELLRRVDDGAAIMVCGSLEGMAPAVDAALRAILGDERLEALAEAGRYRRDIY